MPLKNLRPNQGVKITHSTLVLTAIVRSTQGIGEERRVGIEFRAEGKLEGTEHRTLTHDCSYVVDNGEDLIKFRIPNSRGTQTRAPVFITAPNTYAISRPAVYDS